jgi:hypothetical protein
MTEEMQIDEMARIISEYDECGNCKVCIYHNCCSSEYHATNLYNAGYRKQTEGEWVHTDKAEHWYGKDECSECHYHTFDRTDLSHLNFCPNCGAKMKGGE